MFKFSSHKSEITGKDVLFFGISYIQDMKMLCLDFGRYTINVEWGFTNV